MKNLYKKIILFVFVICLVGGLIANNIYLNNKIERYKQELSNTIMSQTINYSTSEKKEHLTSNDVNDAEETEITEEYITEIVDKYYKQQEKKNATSKNNSAEKTKGVEKVVETVYVDRVQKEETKAPEKNENSNNYEKVKCEHNFEIVEEEDSTCIKQGFIKYKCKKCNYIYTNSLIINEVAHKNELYYSSLVMCKDCKEILNRGKYYMTKRNIVYDDEIKIRTLFEKFYLGNSYQIDITLKEDTSRVSGYLEIEYADGTIQKTNEISIYNNNGNYSYMNFEAKVEGKAKLRLYLTSINGKKSDQIIEKDIEIVDTYKEALQNLNHEHKYNIWETQFDGTNVYVCETCQHTKTDNN